jgi:glycosyltransferase involved in cell wall biosynthesis
MTFISQVLPILVIYNQDFREASSIKMLNRMLVGREERMDLFIYDNSKLNEHTNSFQYENFNVSYIHDPSNPGVSRAYNFGARHAESLNKQWVLLLDQDTVFPEKYLDQYEHAINGHPELNIFVPILKVETGQILSPCKYVHKRGRWPKTMSEGKLDTRTYSPVNSGMMINLDTFFKAGGYNEKIKLDFADFQFMEKVSKVEAHFYVINMIGQQDFSGFESNVQKLKDRFVFFCQGAKNCEREHFLDSWWYFVLVTRRMLSLILKTRRFFFFGEYCKHYVFNSNRS